MAIYAKAISGNNVVNGGSTVNSGQSQSTHAPADRVDQYANLNSLTMTTVLDGRYKVAPSGWSA